MSANSQDIFSAKKGNWLTVANWSAGVAPATEDAFVGAGASGVAAATSATNVTVNSIAINSASTLTLDTASVFTATNGTVLSASDIHHVGTGNAGVIAIQDDATLAIGNSFVNSGVVEMGVASLGDTGNLSLLGNVRLSGGGSILLGLQSGAASTTANISGGGLVNVDNSIFGAGNVTLSSLDNQAGGRIVANSQYVDDLILDVGQFSNEGVLQVGANGLLKVGHDGLSRAMTNSGTIQIGAVGDAAGDDEQLLIAGNYTLSGPGSVLMLGTYGIIASDGVGQATFNNASTILATHNGQIGDANLSYGVDHLTFVNSGTTTASGANVTLTLDTGPKVIGDSGLLRAASGATLVINSSVNIGPAGATAAGSIVAGPGGKVQLNAAVLNAANPQSTLGGVFVNAGGQLDIFTGGSISAPLTIYGNSGASAGGVVNIFGGASVTGPITFVTSGGTLNLANQTASTSVIATGGKVNLSSAQVAVTGANNTISIVKGTGNSATVGGFANVVNGSGASFNFLASSQATLNGSGDAVVAGAGSALGVNGANNTIQASGASVSLGGNAGGIANVVNGAGSTISVLANSLANVNGDNNAITAAAGATLNVVGANTTVQATGDTIAISGAAAGFGDVVSGSGNSVAVLANAFAAVNGDNNVVALGAGARLSLGGANDTVQANNNLFYIAASASGDTVVGSSNRMIVGANATLDVQGDSNKIHIGQGASLTIAGTAERLIGAGFQASAADGTAFWVGGTGPTGAADVVTVNGGAVRIGGNSNIQISGHDDSVSIVGGAHVSLTGASFSAHAGYNVVLSIDNAGLAGAVDTITGAHFSLAEAASSNVALASLGASVTMGDNAVLTVQRSNNTILAGVSDTITLLGGMANQVTLGQNDIVTNGGAGSIFNVVGDVGATILGNFGGPSQSIVDLFNGVGGFATANDAYAALTSDGAGGAMLSLGASGAIDFTGVAAAALSAANFKIG